MYRACLLLLAGLPLGCISGRGQPADEAEDDEVIVLEEEAASDSSAIPGECSTNAGECLPPQDWVTRLCEDVYPDVALHMFQPDTPWQRFYMLARAEPFNASGGASLLGERMETGEEVIALRRRETTGQIQVGDSEGYDVLRWNGSCATIHNGDFSTKKPRSVWHPSLDWRRIGLEQRKALQEDSEVSEVYEARRKSCHGITIGRVTKDCEVNDKKLGETVVRYVSEGGDLPEPKHVP